MVFLCRGVAAHGGLLPRKSSDVLPKILFLFSIADSTASIIARRRRFNHLTQELYELPIVVWDNGEPSLSGTSTLTLRVCPCQRHGRIRMCQGEAFLSSAGLSTGALIAILLCIIILLGELGQTLWGIASRRELPGGGRAIVPGAPVEELNCPGAGKGWKGLTRAEEEKGMNRHVEAQVEFRMRAERVEEGRD